MLMSTEENIQPHTHSCEQAPKFSPECKQTLIIHCTPRKKFYLDLRNLFFNFISSIQIKNSIRTIINLFDFKKSPFSLF